MRIADAPQLVQEEIEEAGTAAIEQLPDWIQRQVLRIRRNAGHQIPASVTDETIGLWILAEVRNRAINSLAAHVIEELNQSGMTLQRAAEAMGFSTGGHLRRAFPHSAREETGRPSCGVEPA